MTTHDLPQRMTRAAAMDPHDGCMPGFGIDFKVETLPGALLRGPNSPQKCNCGLQAEQLSDTAFPAPRRAA